MASGGNADYSYSAHKITEVFPSHSWSTGTESGGCWDSHSLPVAMFVCSLKTTHEVYEYVEGGFLFQTDGYTWSWRESGNIQGQSMVQMSSCV